MVGKAIFRPPSPFFDGGNRGGYAHGLERRHHAAVSLSLAWREMFGRQFQRDQAMHDDPTNPTAEAASAATAAGTAESALHEASPENFPSHFIWAAFSSSRSP